MTAADDNACSYDAVAERWDAAHPTSSYGERYLRRAIELSASTPVARALDVGCGNGRFVAELSAAGFLTEGLDFSTGMLERARARHPHHPHRPNTQFIHADIRDWQPTETYGLIVAWDSIFHLPLDSQRPVVGKLCMALAADGVLLFTAGGVAGEVSGTMYDQPFSYSSLDDWHYLQILRDHGCRCLLLERDQHPHDHVVMIAMRAAQSALERAITA